MMTLEKAIFRAMTQHRKMKSKNLTHLLSCFMILPKDWTLKAGRQQRGPRGQTVNKFWLWIAIGIATVHCSRWQKESVAPWDWKKENPKELSAEVREPTTASVLITGAKVMTAAGRTLLQAHVLVENGRIKKISETPITPPSDTIVIAGEGRVLTPGLIDVHSHMGVYPSPQVDAHEDGNEMTRPVTPEVWAEHGFWPQDPDLWRALEGGITTIQVLPGSGNLIGGRSFVAQLRPNVSPRAMRLAEAPAGLKMACGENPKRTHSKQSMMTRMGNMAHYRKVFQEALEYRRKAQVEKNKSGERESLGKRHFVSETLARVLSGEILVHLHCYRADDISHMLDLAQEYGFKIRTIHHGLEAYKVAHRLANENVATATWADWWGFKAEAFDGTPYGPGVLYKHKAPVVIHSDSAKEIRFLNVEAAKAQAAARHLGVEVSDEEALAWITRNAAWALGLENELGTIEEGKRGDLVLWSGDPLDIASQTTHVIIGGEVVLDRAKKIIPRSDFEIGFGNSVFNDGRQFYTAKPNPPLSGKKITWVDRPALHNEAFVIQNANVFLDGSWKSGTPVWVKDGKILLKGDGLERVPVLDAKGHWLTPGWVEASSQLGLYEISMDSRAQDIMPERSGIHPELKAEYGLHRQSIRVPIHREQGVTQAIAHLRGPIASSTGVAFSLDPSSIQSLEPAIYGSLEKIGFGQETQPTRMEIWADLESLVSETELWIKNPSAVQRGETQALKHGLPSLQSFAPVLKGEKAWVLEAHRVDDIKRLIKLKLDLHKKNYPLRLVISGAAEAWLVAEDLKTAKIPVIVVPSEQTPKDFSQLRARFDAAAYLHEHGVTVIIDDEGDLGGNRVRQEAAIAHRYGLKEEAALSAITENPARVFGLSGGVIHNQARADLVLWNGNPLDPRSKAQMLWIEGREMPMVTRQESLARKYLEP